jgi:hypothetical protein
VAGVFGGGGFLEILRFSEKRRAISNVEKKSIWAFSVHRASVQTPLNSAHHRGGVEYAQTHILDIFVHIHHHKNISVYFPTEKKKGWKTGCVIEAKGANQWSPMGLNQVGRDSLVSLCQ